MTARTFKLDPTLDRAIDELARRRGTSRSVVVREALAAYVRKEGKPLSALDVAGDLVGSLRGGPADLSTNPEHLEGLGEPLRRSRRPRRR